MHTARHDSMEKILQKIASLISERFSKQAVNILDLCCGNGEPTYNLLKKIRRERGKGNRRYGK